jgi:hypothetical protein
MSFIDNCTDTDIESLQEKNMCLQYLAELYNAMVEVAMEYPNETYAFIKKEAKRRMNLGIVSHSYTDEKPPETEQLDG